MRLCKKAAAVLLVAAMAVSMMTACGTTGGGNDNNSSGSGNNGTSQGGDENTDDKGDNGGNKDDQGNKKDDQDDKKDDQGNSVIPADPEKVTWETSMTKNYFQGISKDNFRISGINNITKELFAYATQGKKQIMLRQGEDKNGKKIYMAIFLDEDGQMYAALCDKMPTSVSNISNWQKAEDAGADKDEIKGIEEDMNEYKNVTCAQNIVDGMFHAMVQDGVYVEIAMMKVDNAGYTCVYAFNDQGNMVSMSVSQNNVVDYVFCPATNSKIKTCPDNAFPNIK